MKSQDQPTPHSTTHPGIREGWVFVINIDPHPLIGMTATIWVSSGTAKHPGLASVRLTPGNTADYGLDADDPLAVLCREAASHSPENVLAHFNRKGRVARSLEELIAVPERQKALERHTDRWVAQWLERAVRTDAVLTNGLVRHGLPEKHRITWLRPDRPLQLSFYQTGDGLRYRLRLVHAGRELPLLNAEFHVLAGPSGWALLGHHLLDLDGPAALLKPFTAKEEVFIPARHVPVFLRQFLLRHAATSDIDAHGFDIAGHKQITGCRLGLFQDLFSGRFRVRLAFAYDDFWTPSLDDREIFQRLAEAPDGGFVIHQYHRDLAEEKERMKQLASFGLVPEPGGTLAFADAGEGADFATAARWLISHRDALTDRGWDLEEFHSPQGRLIPAWPHTEEAEPEGGMDWLDIHLQVGIAGRKLPMTRLKETILEGIPFHPMGDGTCFLVPADWFGRFRNWFAVGTIDGETFRFSPAQWKSLNASTAVQAEGDASPAPGTWVLLPSPPGLRATLRPYQQAGFSWMAGLFDAGLGACLADDMGLGKTLQTIALLLHVRAGLPMADSGSVHGQLDLFATSPGPSRPDPLGALIIAPSSLLTNWATELARFAPDLRVLLHRGADRQRRADTLQEADVVITSYPLLVRDEDLFLQTAFRCLVLDESQTIKNPDSRTFLTVHRLHARVRLTLTGTPLENSLSDLWAQMHVINPGILGTFRDFRQHYGIPVERRDDRDRLEQLRALIRPYILRRTKEEVAPELPPLTEQMVYCTMTEEQARIYQAELERVRRLVRAGQAAGRSGRGPEMLNALMRLRQLANVPAQFEEYAGVASGKTETICAELETISRSGHRGLLFSAFLRHLEVYAAYLGQKGIPFDTFTGKDDLRERERAVRALQEEKLHFLLITLRAGGAGLNLYGADYVLLADPWWNPAVERQAIGRAHRIGQTRPVIALRFITQDTIEEKIVRLQQRKQKWSDDLLEEADFLGGLSDGEWEELLED
ncbi:MAG: DEAD/DEAH box helicase [Saprospiraceae bacterium]|nr:DEAD/DEAH box helicase [Saprospiraceae bacterium]